MKTTLSYSYEMTTTKSILKLFIYNSNMKRNEYCWKVKYEG